MVDIVHRVGIKAPVSKVYAALSTIDGMAGWWTTATTGSPKVGGVIAFRFRTENGDEDRRIGHRRARTRARPEGGLARRKPVYPPSG